MDFDKDHLYQQRQRPKPMMLTKLKSMELGRRRSVLEPQSAHFLFDINNLRESSQDQIKLHVPSNFDDPFLSPNEESLSIKKQYSKDTFFSQAISEEDDENSGIFPKIQNKQKKKRDNKKKTKFREVSFKPKKPAKDQKSIQQKSRMSTLIGTLEETLNPIQSSKNSSIRISSENIEKDNSKVQLNESQIKNRSKFSFIKLKQQEFDSKGCLTETQQDFKIEQSLGSSNKDNSFTNPVPSGGQIPFHEKLRQIQSIQNQKEQDSYLKLPKKEQNLTFDFGSPISQISKRQILKKLKNEKFVIPQS